MLNLDKLTHNSFESFSSLFFTYFFTIDVYSSTIIDRMFLYIFKSNLCYDHRVLLSSEWDELAPK